MSNPLGYFIQGQGLGNAEIDALLAHLQRLQPATVGVMDSYGLCIQIQNLLPSCVVVFRDSTFEPAPDFSNAAFTTYLQAHADKRIVIIVNCEQGWNTARVAMWVRFITVADMLGYRLCVGNTSSGSIKSGQNGESNDWLTTGAPLLKILATSQSFLGVHNYTSDFAWVVSNGGWGDPAKPPAVIDWTKPQWHLGREAQGIKAAAKALGIPELIERRPFMIITEGFLDEMNDIRSNPDYPYKGLKSNRWRDCIPAWAKWYPGVNPENVLATQYEWAWDTIYKPLGFVLGAHCFTWADTSGQWAGDRMDNAVIYQRQIEAYKPASGGVITEPPATPPPADTSAARAEVEAQLVVLQNKYVAEFKALMDKLIALK